MAEKINGVPVDELKPEPEQEPEDEFCDVGTLQRFETPGTVIEGVYLGFSVNPEYKPGTPGVPAQHLIAAEDGIFTINETSMLSRLRVVPVGNTVKLAYVNEEMTARGKLKVFRIQVKKTDYQELRKALSSGQISLTPAALPPVVADDHDPFSDDPKYDTPSELRRGTQQATR